MSNLHTLEQIETALARLYGHGEITNIHLGARCFRIAYGADRDFKVVLL